ncbi:hypothetical protein J3U21_00270 [Gilliamella sp. B2776]|uniref:hypothetical protein n=1 Tax=unclassified Gilliamella TaxID=2685620 RepID=UPI00226AAB81|nr:MULTISPECIES: hypothetical protein [unclassified Gilliamella]MCX8648770.1 hypothetical protein [Gilliamella sp. B2779]MCX8653354.1 hypothetical protein [Gilliamella sp. B2737]MCX8655630.1 hypothetical protein [Gilliamella sp. B2894]MCX8664380.1 hypothetical protein [Gilliamella sp. B2887]MCX8690582.1 hypothetical protein [Gilliamella sp. B2776]
MNNDIYNKIGGILITSAPDDSKKIIARIEITGTNDVGTYTFNYINSLGNIKNYRPVSRARDDLFDAILELKKYMLENNLTNGKPIWAGCIVTVDLESSKINIEFKYEPFIEE